MYTKIIAHRGGAALWPENTQVAIDGALALRHEGRGVDGLEVDCHVLNDGVVVVHHDATLERMTDAVGPVRERSAAELAGVQNVGGGGGVPTLGEALAAIAAVPGAIASVEFKRDEDRLRYPWLSRDAVAAVRRHGLASRCYLHAFDFAYLDELLNIAPDLPRAGNVGAETIAELGGLAGVIVALQNRNVSEINIDHRVCDATTLRILHDAGFGVTLWTVNDDADLAAAIASGVYAIATDRPDAALAARAAYAETAPRNLCIESERTLCVPVSEHHMPWLSRLLADDETVRFLLSRQRQLEATRYWMSLFETQGFGMMSVFARDASAADGAGAYLGRVGFNIQQDVDGEDRPEIGWVINRAMWGQGLVPEVCTALLGWARTNAPFDEVIALILPDNHASIRVAEKLGMQVEKTVARFGFDEVLVYQRAL